MPAPIFIPFGPFEPDAAFLNSNVLSIANNVYPAPVGYTYQPEVTSISTVSVSAPLTGGVVIQTSSAGAYSLYYGTTNILRRIDSSNLNSATTITTSTQPTAPALWRFAKFGTKLIAAHAGVAPLYEDWTTGAGAMSTLGGSPPQATGVFTVGDFVFLTGLNSNKRKLQWSEINNAEGWTVGTNLSDEQEFPDGGDIFGIAGDKSGYVIQQNAIRTFQFLPGDTATIFQFNKLQDIPGCVGQHAWVAANQSIFYYSEEGFCSIGPGGFKRIGAHRVDAFFQALNSSLPYLRAVADPYGPRVFFSWDTSGTGSAGGTLVYDWLLDRWSRAQPAAVSFFMEHIDATGGGTQIVHRSGAHNTFGNLTAASGTATLTTSLKELMPGKRSLVTYLRPVVYGTIASAVAQASETLDGSVTSSSGDTELSNGRFSVLSSGGYHLFTVSASSASAANNSKYLTGIQVWAEPAGEA